jgi:hypothetical protein
VLLVHEYVVRNGCTTTTTLTLGLILVGARECVHYLISAAKSSPLHMALVCRETMPVAGTLGPLTSRLSAVVALNLSGPMTPLPNLVIHTVLRVDLNDGHIHGRRVSNPIS